MRTEGRSSLERVYQALAREHLESAIVTLPDSTHTAVAAAAALGCEVAQIAKTIVFRAVHSDRPILVVASGSNRINIETVERLIGEPVRKADAGYVKRRTGFAIGGVAPVGHTESVEIIVDEDLYLHKIVWAAAGTAYTVVSLTAADLVRVSGGRVAAIQ